MIHARYLWRLLAVPLLICGMGIAWQTNAQESPSSDPLTQEEIMEASYEVSMPLTTPGIYVPQDVPSDLSLVLSTFSERLRIFFGGDAVDDAKARLAFADTRLHMVEALLSTQNDQEVYRRARNIFNNANTWYEKVQEKQDKWFKNADDRSQEVIDDMIKYLAHRESVLDIIEHRTTEAQLPGFYLFRTTMTNNALEDIANLAKKDGLNRKNSAKLALVDAQLDAYRSQVESLQQARKDLIKEQELATDEDQRRDVSSDFRSLQRQRESVVYERLIDRLKNEQQRARERQAKTNNTDERQALEDEIRRIEEEQQRLQREREQELQDRINQIEAERERLKNIADAQEETEQEQELRDRIAQLEEEQNRMAEERRLLEEQRLARERAVQQAQDEQAERLLTFCGENFPERIEDCIANYGLDHDGDGIATFEDNCPAVANEDQADEDNSGRGDVCEDPIAELVPRQVPEDEENNENNDGQIIPERNADVEIEPDTTIFDSDGDGVDNFTDNCPNDPNPNQLDSDNDGVGNVCETLQLDIDLGLPENNEPADPEPERNLGEGLEVLDSDADGLSNVVDNCPSVANANQQDTDDDGIGDACDDTPNGDQNNNLAPDIDLGGNGLGNIELNSDGDGDGVDNDEDNCALVANPDQADVDNDGIGDACDDSDDRVRIPVDSDNDGIDDAEDNCPNISNSTQLDTDSDGTGDACDGDDDNDFISDSRDNCPKNANFTQTDSDNDGIGDACDTLHNIDIGELDLNLDLNQEIEVDRIEIPLLF